ncbi:MAG: family channel protein [Actinomycetia bacterium]|nr:family channel protein [Actinomycetes bacterium]
MTATLTRPSTADAIPQQATANTGLHGHRFDTHIITVTFVEAIGTFVLVLAIVSAVIAATLADPIAGNPYGSLTVPFAGGVALAILAASLGPVSGAHLNPAVTVGLALNRKFPWTRVLPYAVAQFAGAIGAALIAWWFYGPRARSVAHLGATAPAAGVSAWRTFGVEAVVTFILVLVVVAVAGRGQSNLVPVAIGAALAAAILISGPITGAGVNPARAIGPMIAAGTFTDWWIYLIAPLVGGGLAATFSARFLT